MPVAYSVSRSGYYAWKRSRRGRRAEEDRQPTQNAYIERFNGSFRREVLDAYLFTSLSQVRNVVHQWLVSYNEEHPRDSLDNLPPSVFRRTKTTTSTTNPRTRTSTSKLPG